MLVSILTLQIDNVYLPSWQAQIKGIKRWTIETPTECLYKCQEKYEVDMFPGDISILNKLLIFLFEKCFIIMFFILYFKFCVLVVLDTNLWYHATEVLSDEISITIGAEYD